MVDFNRRFDRDYAELQRVVTSGGIGSVELIQMTSRGPAMPPLEYVAVSGGQMRDQTVHFFDLARWISGLDPESVFATGSTLAEPRLAEYGDVDTSAVTLRLPGGALVQIDCTRRIGYGYDERIEVLGSTGMVEARRQRAGSVSRYSAGRVVDDGLHAGWFERIRGSYRTALDHFVDALENGSRDRPDPRGGAEGAGDRRSRDALTHQRPDGADRAMPDLVATAWTSAGAVSPMDSPAISPVPIAERVAAIADAGYCGFGLIADDLAVVRDTIGYGALRDLMAEHGLTHIEIELIERWWIPRREPGHTYETRDLLMDAADTLSPAFIKIGS